MGKRAVRNKGTPEQRREVREEGSYVDVQLERRASTKRGVLGMSPDKEEVYAATAGRAERVRRWGQGGHGDLDLTAAAGTSELTFMGGSGAGERPDQTRGWWNHSGCCVWRPARRLPIHQRGERAKVLPGRSDKILGIV